MSDKKNLSPDEKSGRSSSYEKRKKEYKDKVRGEKLWRKWNLQKILSVFKYF